MIICTLAFSYVDKVLSKNCFRQYFKMKKYLAAIFFILCLTGCEKHPDDYRDKYLGDYTFNIHETGNTSSGSIDTVYNYNGKITYGNDDHGITIYCFPGGSYVNITLNEDGSLSGWFTGKFINTNEIIFTIISGGPVFSTEYNISGERQ
jgi:hypothetical protein